MSEIDARRARVAARVRIIAVDGAHVQVEHVLTGRRFTIDVGTEDQARARGVARVVRAERRAVAQSLGGRDPTRTGARRLGRQAAATRQGSWSVRPGRDD